MKLFSDLISLATTSWNQEPYNTTFALLLRSIQDLQTNKTQDKQKRVLLVVGFFPSHYFKWVIKYKVWLEKLLTESFRAIHKKRAPHKYCLFWTTDRSLEESEGANFFISICGIRIQGAKNTMVDWQTKMFHGTSLAKLDSIDSDRGREDRKVLV